MLESFLLVASQVATLFLMMSVGFIMVKLGQLNRSSMPQITAILLNFVTPCVIINALQTEKDSDLLVALGITCVIAFVVSAINALIIFPLFRKCDANTRPSIQCCAIYGNTGFMGLPLAQAVLGDEAMIYASVVFLVFMVFNWSHGIGLMGGKESFSLKNLFFNPGIIAAAIGVGLFWFEITLPSVVGNAVGFLAGANTPLAMIVIGAQMAWADIPATFRKPLLFQGASLKLVILPLLTALLLLPFNIPPLIYCTIVILSATPTAGVISMFAVRLSRDEEVPVQMITLTTLLSIISLPLFGALSHLLAYG